MRQGDKVSEGQEPTHAQQPIAHILAPAVCLILCSVPSAHSHSAKPATRCPDDVAVSTGTFDTVPGGLLGAP